MPPFNTYIYQFNLCDSYRYVSKTFFFFLYTNDIYKNIQFQRIFTPFFNKPQTHLSIGTGGM